MKSFLALGVCLVALVAVPPVAAQTPAGAGRSLSVVSAGPTGEVASLAEANEIRIVFSEPMVSLGRIPSAGPAALRDHHAGHSRSVPLVGDDDPHLYAGREDAAAVRHPIRRHR